MKCELKQAREYKTGFKNNLIFTGFKDGEIEWLGEQKEFDKMREDLKFKEICSDCCGANVYYIDNAGKSGMCGDCKEWCGIEYLEDEDDDLLGDKIRMEYQDNMRDSE